VAHRDGSSMGVNLLYWDSEDLLVRQSNDTESLVDLKVVDVLEGNTSVSEGLGDSKRGGSGELDGLVSSLSPAEDLGYRGEIVFLESGGGDEDDGGGTVGERGSIGGGDGTGGDEGRAHGL